MEIENKQLTKSKAFSIKSVMSNKKLSLVISDAINSPLGSIKRKKAQNLLLSLQKSSMNYGAVNDGAGGFFGDIWSGIKNIGNSNEQQATTEPNQSMAQNQSMQVQSPNQSMASSSSVYGGLPAQNQSNVPNQSMATSQPQATQQSPFLDQIDSVYGQPPSSTKLITKSVDSIMPGAQVGPTIERAAQLPQVQPKEIFDLNFDSLAETRAGIESSQKGTQDAIKDKRVSFWKNIGKTLFPQFIGAEKNIEKIKNYAQDSKEAVRQENQKELNNFLNYLSGVDNKENLLDLEKTRELHKSSVFSWSDDVIPIGLVDIPGGSLSDRYMYMPKDFFIGPMQDVPLSTLLKEFNEIRQENPGLGNEDYYAKLKEKYAPEEAIPFNVEAAPGEEEVLAGEPPEATEEDAQKSADQAAYKEELVGYPEEFKKYMGVVSQTLADPVQADSVEQYFSSWKESGSPALPSANQFGASSEIDYNVGDVIGMIESGGDEAVSSFYNSLDPSAQSYYSSALTEAKKLHDAGMGADAFAQTIMGDKKQLAALLNLPEEAMDSLPDNGLLSTQLNDLMEAVKSNNKLDEQLDKITSLKKTGYTLTNDLQNYVKGKDDYLGQIDKLIDETTEAVSKMDTSNPYVASRMKNYLSYLTILQGRQNKRYTDFLNDSIDQYNADINSSIDLYEVSSNRAQEEYSKLASVNTESYNAIMGSLKGLYNALDGQDAAVFENQKNYYDLLKAQLDIEGKILDNEKTQNEIDGGGTEWDKAEVEKIYNFMGITHDADTDSFSFSTYMPYEAVDWGATAGQKPDYNLNKYTEAAVKDIGNGMSQGTFIDSLTNHVGGYITGAQAYNVDEESANKYNSKLLNLLEQTVKSNSKDFFIAQSDDLKDAIKDLTGVDRTGFDKPQYSSGNANSDMKKFVNKYRPVLGDYADMLWDSFYATTVEGVGPEKAKITPEQFAYRNDTKLVDLDNKSLASIMSNETWDTMNYSILSQMGYLK